MRTALNKTLYHSSVKGLEYNGLLLYQSVPKPIRGITCAMTQSGRVNIKRIDLPKEFIFSFSFFFTPFFFYSLLSTRFRISETPCQQLHKNQTRQKIPW